MEKLSSLRNELESELEELTASLFQVRFSFTVSQGDVQLSHCSHSFSFFFCIYLLFYSLVFIVLLLSPPFLPCRRPMQWSWKPTSSKAVLKRNLKRPTAKYVQDMHSTSTNLYMTFLTYHRLPSTG